MVILDLKVRISLLVYICQLSSLGLDIIGYEYSKCKCFVRDLFRRSQSVVLILLAKLLILFSHSSKTDCLSVRIKRPILRTWMTDDERHRKT